MDEEENELQWETACDLEVMLREMVFLTELFLNSFLVWLAKKPLLDITTLSLISWKYSMDV